MRNNIQNLIQYLITQGVILENDKESVSLRCDEKGCLIVTYDPTGDIIFNSCEDVTGEIGEDGITGVILDGTIGPVGTTNVGQTGLNGLNGFNGLIGITGFSPTGPTGDSGFVINGPVGLTQVGQTGTNSTTTLNFPTLHLAKTVDTAYSTSTDPNLSDIFYDNVISQSIAGMYNLSTNIFRVPFSGYYNVSNTIFLEFSNAGAPDTYARIRYFNNSTATYIDNGGSMYSVLRGAVYNIQLRHQNIVYLTAGDLITFKVELFNFAGKATDVIQKANSFTNQFVRSSELFLYMISV